jgi:23S rRNA (guanosine2251-2'-O)-methyltransferase
MMSKHRKLTVSELNRISADECKNVPKNPVVIVLDNVRSLNNIGSVFRTCDALNVKKLLICGISATPPHPDIYKTALGAENSVCWQYFSKTEDAIQHLRETSFNVFAIEQTANSVSLLNFTPVCEERYAFIFGNELKGISQSAIDLSDGAIEIPQFGSKHSFNVAVTAGIVLWDFLAKISK